MPDLLIIPLDSNSYFEFEKVGKEEGYRVKVIQEIVNARDWLKLRPFDVLLIDAQTPLSEQQKLADLLWEKNPAAHMISFSSQAKTPSDATQARLFGVEAISGPGATEAIRDILSNVRRPKSYKAEDFKILVVEDLDSPRDIICVYLESLGFGDVTGVASAKEALEILNADPEKYACVLTDIRMPQMTGSEMIKRIRSDANLSKLPIIVLTAYGTVDCLIDCLKSGASGFLIKPPKRPDMVRELGRAMRIRSSGKHARLASSEEAEYVQELLEKRGGF